MKPWYKRRRYWLLALLAALVYFCFIPSPLRVSPETTGYTEPLLPNGDVDYFGVYEKSYIHKLSPPEDNGYRLLLAACGPRILEQNAIIDAVPWEQLPTHEIYKQWFENRWVPLCEHMYIDPYIKPEFLDSQDYYGFMMEDWQAKHPGEKVPSGLEQEHIKLWEKLTDSPWTAEEQPDVTRWLEERSSVLDLFGKAVRKHNFACYRWNSETLFAILLPDVQANRSLARDLRLRVTERLGKKDIDGAWYDVMSMFTLPRKHYVHDPVYVVKLVGLAIEGQGVLSARALLQHSNLTPEQLERFAHDLDSLPRTTTLISKFELQAFAYSMLQALKATTTNPDTQYVLDDLFSDPNYVPPDFLTRLACLKLPLDRNIAGKRITDFFDRCRKTSNSTEHIHSITTSMVAKRYYANMEQQLEELGNRTGSFWNVLRLPLIRTRSQWVADTMIRSCLPAIMDTEKQLEHSNARYDLLRIQIALERYKLTQESYPQVLEALVPAYLEEVPLDPPSGRKSWTYKLSPDEETAYLLHSSAWDSTGEDKSKKELVVRKAK